MFHAEEDRRLPDRLRRRIRACSTLTVCGSGSPPRESLGTAKQNVRYHSSVPTYHVENFGCRATQADGAAVERQFESRGLERASAAQADLVILNTCTVTNSADRDARAAIRRVRRQNPLAKIIVTGCYAQRAPQEIAALPGVSCVIGNSHKHQLAEIALPFLSDLGWRSTSSVGDRAHRFSRRLQPARAWSSFCAALRSC